MNDLHYLETEPELWQKLERLLMSEQIANIELAFQMMQGLSFDRIPKDVRPLLSRNGNSIGACLKYGFVEALKDLKQIYLKDVEIEALPSNISQLEQLQRLELRNSNIEELPSQIAFLKKLETLELSGNQLKELPNEIGYLQNLHLLELSQGKLQSLNSRTAELTRLQKLKLSQNQLRYLPEELWNLPKLSFLDLSYNRLERVDLPYRIENRRNPLYVFLQGNPLLEDEKKSLITRLPFAKITF